MLDVRATLVPSRATAVALVSLVNVSALRILFLEEAPIAAEIRRALSWLQLQQMLWRMLEAGC